MYALKVYVI